jgi:predicted nucleic acid-binding protein
MSARLLLDTSVYSQPLRNRPVMAALRHWKNTGDAACATCEVVVSEVEFGLHLENSEERWRKYRHLLEGRLEILPMDREVWSSFSRIKARQCALGRPVADLDLLIAACAVRYGLGVATLNAKNFSNIEGLRWLDWST